MTTNAYFGPNLAVFGPKILIFRGVSESFGTNITENHLDNLSALFFGQALDQMGQIWLFLGQKSIFWGVLFFLGPKTGFSDLKFCQWPICSSRRDGSLAIFGSIFWLLVSELHESQGADWINHHLAFFTINRMLLMMKANHCRCWMADAGWPEYNVLCLTSRVQPCIWQKSNITIKRYHCSDASDDHHSDHDHFVLFSSTKAM